MPFLQLASFVRFYLQTMHSKCKVECNGVPVLKRLSSVRCALIDSSFPHRTANRELHMGKQFFIGCSKWTRAEQFNHRYLPIPNNVDEQVLRFAMDNGGQFPAVQTVNELCALTVHPRIGAKLNGCRMCNTTRFCCGPDN